MVIGIPQRDSEEWKWGLGMEMESRNGNRV